MPTIVFNPFARRQTAESSYSHTTLSEDEVIALVEANLDKGRPSGFNPKVLEVPVPADDFYSATVKMHEGMDLVAVYKARREGEDPRLSVGVRPADGDYEAAKQPAVAVDIIVFPSAVLAENGDNTLEPVEGNFEIVSMTARMCEGPEPMHPNAFMANHFEETGGTATGLSDEEFVAQLRIAREFWRQHARLV